MAEASAPEKLTHPSDKNLKDGSSEKEMVQHEQVPEEEEEEEETCAFCKFMKGGGCKEVFVSWMECVDSEKAKGNDFVETCMTQIQDLRECMLANPDYYRPMLEEEDEYLTQREAAQEEESRQTSNDSVRDSDAASNEQRQRVP